MSSTQDAVGRFVDFNIDFSEPESLTVGAVFSKDLAFNGDVWRVHCYPRGAPGDDGAGEYLSFHLVNTRTARSGTLLFGVTLLGRSTDPGAAASGGNPPSLHRALERTFDYPRDPARVALTRIFRTSVLAERYAVCGYVTLVCDVVALRHSPIPVPQSSAARDLRGLEVQNRYGAPDVTCAVADGKSVHVNRSVLSARSPILRKLLDDAAMKLTTDGREEEAAAGTTKMITMDALPGLQAWTFYAMIVFIYSDRLPGDNECCGAPVTTERLRDLLAAADRYRMHRLKLMCAKKLWEDVSVENVSRTLWYAHHHNCRELKKACINFITVADNAYRVMLTDGFQWLRQESPAIIEELKQRSTRTYL